MFVARSLPWLLLATSSCAWAVVPEVPATMRAVVAQGPSRAGDFSQIEVVKDHPVPTPGRGQLLIKVVASSVNPVDWKILEFPGLGIRFPHVMGFDVAGVVAEVGPGCERLKVGDHVWADLGKASTFGGVQLGAYAEFAVADESQVDLKPTNLGFKDAASLPLVGLTDLQALKKVGAPWTGRKNLTVVVTSGSGGTGTVAIQLARAYGAASVITAASAEHAALLEGLGATQVVDHHKASLWDVLPADSVDVVYDNYGAPGTADAAMAALRPGGAFIFLPGKGGDVSAHPKPGVRQINYGLCESSHREDLAELRAVAEAGHLRAVVQKSFPLEGIVAAYNASMAGHVVGKLSIDVAAASQNRQIVV